MPTYVVECYWPGVSKEQAEKALATIGQCQRTTSTLRNVYPLGCKGLARVLTTHAEQASPSNHMISIPTEGSSNGTENDTAPRICPADGRYSALAPHSQTGDRCRPQPRPTFTGLR